MNRPKRMSSASAPTAPSGPPDPWAETRAQTALATQFLKDENDYLADPKHEIGRHTGKNEHELFVSCAPAEALQQQLEHHRPDFIAVHDIGTAASRKLLAGVAAAMARTVQRLVIRRQGYGTALATLEFVELATANGGSLRMYSTDATDAGTSRAGITRALLGFARLGVVMVGDLPQATADAALKPLHDDMLAGPWPSRHLLLLPLAAAATWVAQGVELTRGTGVGVRTTPQVKRPADAWNFISGTWARMRDQEGGAAGVDALPALAHTPAASSVTASATAPAATPPPGAPSRPGPDFDEPTQPMPLSMRPMPKVQTAAERAAGSQDVFERYVQQVADLAGMVSCCVFDMTSRRALAHAGASPGADDLALHGAELLQNISASCRTLKLGHALPEAAITLGGHHLLLRALPRHPGLALHAVLDKTHANLTLARLQVLRLDALLDPSSESAGGG